MVNIPRRSFHIHIQAAQSDSCGMILAPIAVGLFLFAIVFSVSFYIHSYNSLYYKNYNPKAFQRLTSTVLVLERRRKDKLLMEKKTVSMEKIIKTVGNWSCINDKNITYDYFPKETQFTVLSICNPPDKIKSYYITLFTTMFFKPTKLFIFNNTLHVISTLQPFVTPVLFMTPIDLVLAHELVQEACRLGWGVYSVPLCNQQGYPVLKAMYHVVQKEYDSVWYGYSNGDILFGPDLITSLEYIRQLKGVYKDSFLIGQRRDLQLPPGKSLTRPEDLIDYISNTTIHMSWGLDYFFTAKGGFSWQNIPPFVIGQPRYDNWLAWYAIKSPNVMDIDATYAILAVHQGIQGRRDGWASVINITSSFNSLFTLDKNNRYPKGYEASKGSTDCAHYAFERLTGRVSGYKIYRKRVKTNHARCRILERSIVYQT